MRTLDAVIGVGWLAFWIYWLVAATGVKRGRTAWGRFAGARVVIAVIIVTLSRTGVFNGHRTHAAWLGAIGVAAWASGLALCVWARIYLGRNWGTPMSQKDEPELVTTGPYRWVRNPIYTGLIVAMLGTALAVSVRWLVLAALLGAYFVYSAVMEQRFMEATFPDSYPAYKRSTKMLVPFVF